MTSFEKPDTPESQIQAAAEKLYSPDLPYHNFQHALNIAARAQEIVGQCHEENVEIDGQVVYLAALFHDAGYHRDHIKEGYQTKEELSAALAKEELTKLGISLDVIEKVVSTILATHREGEFSTNEQKALRATDLSGLAGSYDDFLRNTILIKREFEMLRGKQISWREWKIETQKLIGFYLSQDIRLTSKHDDEEGRSVFHSNAENNLQRFLGTSTAELESLESKV